MRQPYHVLHAGRVVGKGDTPASAWRDAEAAGAPRAERILIRVPRRDEACSFEAMGACTASR